MSAIASAAVADGIIISRPVFRNSTIPAFTFSYWILNKKEGAPTIIFFQSGPGPVLESIAPDIFPHGYQVLLFDPRGTGQSPIEEPFRLDPNSSSSLQIAEDVLAVLQTERAFPSFCRTNIGI